MEFKLLRTNSDDKDFQKLVIKLDQELRIRDGDDHEFYAQFNSIQSLKQVIVAYQGSMAVGCGAIKEFDLQTMEVKRMFVLTHYRAQGIATLMLLALEDWTRELGFDYCILETGLKQPEAIQLYTKNNYERIPNYGPYTDIQDSVCFKKKLNG
ncbi:MAG: GNAT family N-acetyltransferase [Chitinophagaceae bacterium]|nr:GNAT family N-acetyltransferase [Chitinophagaceae bacterium]